MENTLVESKGTEERRTMEKERGQQDTRFNLGILRESRGHV